MFYWIIFLYWFLVVLKVQFSSLCCLFSVVHEHRLQEYSKCRAYQTLFSYKAINKKNKHNKFFIMLKRNSFNVHWKFGACQKWEPAGRIGDFGNFLNGFAKSPRVLRWSRILNECNFSWKIVKYCILYEVCLIKTAPHSTLSPQMWCIKKIKDWFARTQIYWQEFVNLSNAKNSVWFVFQEFVFHALSTVIKSHYCS